MKLQFLKYYLVDNVRQITLTSTGKTGTTAIQIDLLNYQTNMVSSINHVARRGGTYIFH